MIYTITLSPSIDYYMTIENIDMNKEVNRTSAEKVVPGGKGINVSLRLKDLGLHSIALGFLGGFSGKFIRESLKKSGITEDFTEIKAPTKINVKLPKMDTAINAKGPVISNDEVESFMKKLKNFEENDTVIISGSIPRGFSDDAFLEMIKLLREKKTFIALDTHPYYISLAMKIGVNFIKPNLPELETLTEILGLKDKPQTLEKLITQGIDVMHTRGPKGVLFINQTNYIEVPAINVNVKNTVGAGDTSIAGYIYCKEMGYDKKYSVIFANKLASYYVSQEPGKKLNIADFKSTMEV